MLNNNSNPVTIANLPDIGRYKTELHEDKQTYPYWVTAVNRYYIDTKQPGDPPSFCNGAGSLGRSYDNALPFSVTLCSQILTTLPSLNSPITDRTPSQSLFPTTGTAMLHELIHFAQGGKNTPDGCCEPKLLLRVRIVRLFMIEGVHDCMGLFPKYGFIKGRAKAILNPNTYTMLAVAYYYSIQDFDGTSGTGNSHLYYDLSNGFARSLR